MTGAEKDKTGILLPVRQPTHEPISRRTAAQIDVTASTIHPPPTLGETIGMAAEVAHGTCTDVPASRKK